MLKYLENKEIDKKRWDESIGNSLNELVYANSWFLDAVCPGWSAIVDDNYEALMPLPLRKKWGISYVFPPIYAQQLGVFYHYDSKNKPEEFLNVIPKHIQHISLKLNEYNKLTIKSFWLESTNDNYTLLLNSPYEKLLANYSENTKRNLKKAIKSHLSLCDISKDEFLEFKIKNPDKKKYSKELFLVLERLIDTSMKQNVGRIWAIKDVEGRIHAALFWICTENRSYYLSPTSSEEGKESRAMFFLVDRIIHAQSDKMHVLDFQGSNIESIARFYKGFNSEKSLYLSLSLNRLPWPLKLIKP